MDIIQCPACGAINPIQADVCQECNEDLNTVKTVLDTANRHYNEALALAQSGRLDEAVGQAEAAIAMSSHNPNYHLLLGTVHAQNENWDDAVQAWERCITLTPEMEKAYRNIEKARLMQEEIEHEKQERPYFLTSIAAVIVAGLLLVTTGFYAYQAYAKNGQMVQLVNAVNAKTSESAGWKQKFETLNANFPQEGLAGMIAQVGQWKKLAEERAASIEQQEKRYKDMLEQRNTEIQNQKEIIKERDETISNLKKTMTQINPLRHQIIQKNKEIEGLQKKIEEMDAAAQTNAEQIAQLTSQLNETRTNLDENKSDSQDSIQQIRSEYDQKIESLRGEIQQLLDQTAQKDREIADMQYADNLTTEAVQKMEAAEFVEASGLIQKALERCRGHKSALYYQGALQEILNNPVEKELLVQLNSSESELRDQIRNRLAKQYMDRAEGLLEQGDFESSIRIARQTLAFLPPSSSEAQRCSQLIREAEDSEATVTRQISEVRGYLEKQDYRKAKALLKEILRIAPASEEAIALQRQVNP
ncbi:MAG: tetratricopeptide repeat protein [Candidatus Omnitrophica bacterium]|nr:tetratricopeptide repeat protein [Candidatus Omnitrophota bacterium]